MATGFRLGVEIDAGADRVRDALADLHVLADLHPLIESIEELPRDVTSPDTRHYRVVDRIAVGPLSLRVTYEAWLRIASRDEVRGRAEQFPRVRLDTVYRLRPGARPGATAVDEVVRVEAPWGLRAWVCRAAEAAHHETLVRLKRHLESAHEPGDGAVA